ncbi:hypothetical protein [Pseudomonas sp. CMR5c]|uniref:hypothetical protein n=1 Tax=Pseudomonas sp. CMR5c TaxID=658630 RepID=UPI000F6F2881|nr:hypothetical protein [Pseudomonas sp. CMR5c]AZC17554.1 hypothetical protein C4K40_2165 [Pseudomonas sp. CMR5c]
MPETKKPRRGESRQGFGNEISFEEEIVMNEHTEVTEKLNAGASKVPVTVERTFTICNVERQELFAVQPGISAVDALGEASCILSELKGQLEFMAMGGNAIPSINAWSFFRAVDSVKAVIDSVQAGLEEV